MVPSPLAGIQAVDLTRTVAGMYCCHLLEQYGVRVTRASMPTAQAGASESSFARAYKAAVSSALRDEAKLQSVETNADWPRERERLLESIRRSRVVISDSTPAELNELGLGYEELKQLRSDVICVSISPFGLDATPSFAGPIPEIVIEALSGLMALTGLPEKGPLKLGGSHAQVVAGAYAALAALAACLAPSSIQVDVSNVHAVAVFAFAQVCDYSYRGVIALRPVKWGSSPREVFRARDGFVFAMLRPIHNTTLDDIAAFLSALPGDPTTPVEVADPTRLEAIAAAKFAVCDADFVVGLAQSFRIAFSKIQRFDALAECPQLAAYVGQGGALAMRPFDLDPRSIVTPASSDLAGDASRSYTTAEPTNLHLRQPGPFLPLTGIRIIAPEQIYAGPIATLLLGSLGADVVRVESADRPDGFPSTRGKRGYFNEVNRSKRAISLNLKTKRGREAFLELASHCDVVLENYTRRVMSQFDLEFERLSSVNPRLIMVSSTGFGHRGPWADYKAYGPNIEFACGLGFLTGYGDGMPVRPGGLAYGDVIAGLYGALAVVVALLHRQQNGTGSFIDLSYYRVMVSSLGHEMAAARALGADRIESAYQNNRDISNEPQGAYKCAGDDNWAVLSIRTDDEWRRFASLIEDLRITDYEHASRAEREFHREVIDQILRDWFRGQDRDLVVRGINAIGVPAAPVLDPYETLFRPPTSAAYEWIDHTPQGWHAVRPHFRPPWQFLGRHSYQSFPAPARLGNDNYQVLSEYLDYSIQDVQELLRQGVLGNEPSELVTEPDEVPAEQLLSLGQIKSWDPLFLERLGISNRSAGPPD